MKYRLEAKPLTDVDHEILWRQCMKLRKPIDRRNFLQRYADADRRDADIMHTMGHAPTLAWPSQCKVCEQFFGYYIDVALAWWGARHVKIDPP